MGNNTITVPPRLSKRMTNGQRSTLTVAVRWIVLSGIVLWLVLPLLPLLIWSFSFRWVFPSLLPEQWSLRAWEYVFSPASQVLNSLFDTTIIAGIVTLLSMMLSIGPGRALGLYRFRGKRFVEFFILTPVIVPGLAFTLGIQVAFIKLGLADSLWGVILVQLVPTLPYVVQVMAGVFANFDPEFEEQARSLGAGPLRTFWHITLPAIFPGLVVAGLFAFLISWTQYILTLLIGGGIVKTLPLLLFAFARGGDNAITGALSIVFVAPSVLILIFTAKYLTGENATIGGFGRI